MLRINRILYSSRDDAKHWSDAVISPFSKFGPNEMNSVPCVFYKNEMTVICYVSDLLVLPADIKEMEGSTRLDLRSSSSRTSAYPRGSQHGYSLYQKRVSRIGTINFNQEEVSN